MDSLPSNWPEGLPPVRLLSLHICCSVDDLFDVLFSATEFQTKLHEIRKDIQFSSTGWRPSEEAMPDGTFSWQDDELNTEDRTCSSRNRYRKIRFTTTPTVAYAAFDTVERQQISEFLPGHRYMVECQTNTTAPYGEHFTVYFRYVFLPCGPDRTYLFLSYAVQFRRTVNLFIKPFMSSILQGSIVSSFAIWRKCLELFVPASDVSAEEETRVMNNPTAALAPSDSVGSVLMSKLGAQNSSWPGEPAPRQRSFLQKLRPQPNFLMYLLHPEQIMLIITILQMGLSSANAMLLIAHASGMMTTIFALYILLYILHLLAELCDTRTTLGRWLVWPSAAINSVFDLPSSVMQILSAAVMIAAVNHGIALVMRKSLPWWSSVVGQELEFHSSSRTPIRRTSSMQNSGSLTHSPNSTAPANPAMNGHMPHMNQYPPDWTDEVAEEVFEYERLQPFRGWGHTWPGHFLPSDYVAHWGDVKGNVCSHARERVEPPLPHGWTWGDQQWEVDLSGRESTSVDEEGWQYALDFPFLRYPPVEGNGENSYGSFVRRRRWVRTRQRIQPPVNQRPPVASGRPRGHPVMPLLGPPTVPPSPVGKYVPPVRMPVSMPGPQVPLADLAMASASLPVTRAVKSMTRRSSVDKATARSMRVVAQGVGMGGAGGSSTAGIMETPRGSTTGGAGVPESPGASGVRGTGVAETPKGGSAVPDPLAELATGPLKDLPMMPQFVEFLRSIMGEKEKEKEREMERAAKMKEKEKGRETEKEKEKEREKERETEKEKRKDKANDGGKEKGNKRLKDEKGSPGLARESGKEEAKAEDKVDKVEKEEVQELPSRLSLWSDKLKAAVERASAVELPLNTTSSPAQAAAVTIPTHRERPGGSVSSTPPQSRDPLVPLANPHPVSGESVGTFSVPGHSRMGSWGWMNKITDPISPLLGSRNGSESAQLSRAQGTAGGGSVQSQEGGVGGATGGRNSAEEPTAGGPLGHRVLSSVAYGRGSKEEGASGVGAELSGGGEVEEFDESGLSLLLLSMANERKRDR